MKKNESKEKRKDIFILCLLCAVAIPLIWFYLNMLFATLPYERFYVSATVSSSDTHKENPPYEEVQETYYVMNIRSKIIHLPTCQSVEQMSEKNKFITSTWEITDGYRPCKRCNPQPPECEKINSTCNESRFSMAEMNLT